VFHSSGRAPWRSWTEAAVNHHVQDGAHHVNGDMTLAAVNLLGVVPAPAGTGDGVRGPDGLGVDDGGGGLGLAAGSGPDQGAQLCVQLG
jgi:hypothetical protein